MRQKQNRVVSALTLSGHRGRRNPQGDYDVYPRDWPSTPASRGCVDFAGHDRVAVILGEPERLRQT